MDPYRKDINRRRKDPFDFFGFDDEFERMFREMERMMERTFRMANNKLEPGKSFVRGFHIRVGPDGIPHIDEFGNHQIPSDKGETSISEEREPLTDVIESPTDISVTMELPGVEKKDIDLRVTEKELEIIVNTPQRKYHKTVEFSGEVKPKTTKATYKNGILDVVMQRRKVEQKDEDGYHIDIH